MGVLIHFFVMQKSILILTLECVRTMEQKKRAYIFKI